MSEYEIILVDDESPDSCPSICDAYAAAHDNIRVIHQENGGLSAARNAGLKIAKGEYVCFVDSDDYIESNVLGSLLEQMERDQLDVLRYRLQYVRIKNEGVKELKNEWEYEIYNPYKSNPFKGNDYSKVPTDGVSFLNSRMSTACYAWAFILRRELLKDCLFTEGVYFEDTDWTPRMLVRAKRVASTNTIVYNYLLKRSDSITNAVSLTKQKKVLEDKMRLIGEMQRQADCLRKEEKETRWFERMISDTIISIIGIISMQFYAERAAYIERIKKMGVLPICGASMKARLINFSPKLMVEVLHLKNK